MATTAKSPQPHTGRRAPLPVTVASWAVPVMVVGQFALIAGLPVMIVLVGAHRSVRDRAVRWATTLLAVAYAVPLVVWLARPDGAQSLSKDMHPVFAALIVATSAAVIATLHRSRTRRLPAR